MKINQLWFLFAGLVVASGLAACAANQPTATPAVAAPTEPRPTPTPTDMPLPADTPAPTATSTGTPPPSPTITPLPTATATGTSTPTPAPSPTPDPLAGLTIANLASRATGAGEISIEETLAENSLFTRYLVTYPSEGLTLYGFLNVPQGEGPFPVAIVMHGYIAPARYNTIAYTTRYADALARAGYAVLHPNYRNWPPSDSGPDLFRASHAVDALNLAGIIRTQAGQPGPLEKASPEFIGMMGHSMGGGITLRTITVANAINAAVLYGSMSGDEAQNYQKILEWSGGTSGTEELAVSQVNLERIGAWYHLENISVPVSIHHGENDGTVPPEWSQELCRRLESLGKTVECFTYPGQPHTFREAGDQLFIQRLIDFFDRRRQID